MAELVDALDLGSSSGDRVGVQVSPLAPNLIPASLWGVDGADGVAIKGAHAHRSAPAGRDFPVGVKSIICPGDAKGALMRVASGHLIFT
ncbi:hypothetical protein DESC_970029 [Desulfosarcina cetonica]|nr:hypothetical protein DESC_970029 [Desulfosarcina cetonica]